MGTVGIIGGADGPTAIFITGKIGGTAVITMALLAVAVIGIGVFIWKKRKK